MNRPKPSIAAHFRPKALLIAGIAILAMLAASCTRRSTDARLERIAQYVGNQPRKALAALDSIDYPALATHDRHFYDFLRIKASDKAYIDHTSDSLVLDVIRWYEANPQYGLYPDALYYGGRVYCDLGDKPTALRYFQQALDLLPETTDKTALRACVVSQTGRLLDNLRLYKESIPYIEESLRMDRMLNDTLNEILDLQLLGSTQLRDSNYREAEKHFRQSLKINQNIDTEERTMARMLLGAIKYYTGDIDSALLLVRNTPDSVSLLAQSSALAYAARIYKEAGIPDTALIYAERLIRHPENLNKTIAYHILLSPELSGVVNPDSVPVYARRYNDIVNRYFNENENQLALDRQNIYNYDLHEREREKAEAFNQKLIYAIIAILFLVMIMAIIILYLKNKNKTTFIKLSQAIDNVARLKQRLSIAETDTNISDLRNSDSPEADAALKRDTFATSNYQQSANQLREELKNGLYSLYMQNPSAALSKTILQSPVYRELQDKINFGSILQDNDPFWAELERLVLLASPEFKTNLMLLTGGKLTSIDLHTALLVKCHISPSKMSSLLGRTKSTIVSRRQSLCLRVFDKKMGIEVIDGIIRLL